MDGASVLLNEVDGPMDLPPGFRFHPTDEEIVTHYLTRKVMDSRFSALAIAEVDMNKCEPWDLSKKSKMEGKEHYFFYQRDRKYPTGMRTNRATERGYWKATGKDKEIYKGKNLVGMKKTLVFYKGRAPKGEKTNWVTHEFRLEGNFSYYNFPKGAKDEWVVCRVFHKNVGLRRSPTRDLTRVDSVFDHLLDDSSSLPPLMDVPSFSTDIPSSSFSHDAEEFKGVGATTASGKLSSDHAKFSYFSTNIRKLERQHDEQNSFFIRESYNYPFKNSYELASSRTNPNSIFSRPPLSIPVTNFLSNYQNQSHPFSGFKATPDQADSSTLPAAIQGISDSERHCCKVEPFSSNNNSMVSPSQDTGNSNDLAPEISSIEHNNKSFEDLEGISIDPRISDLDSWEYY